MILVCISIGVVDSIIFSPFGNHVGIIYFLGLSLGIIFIGFGTPPKKITFDLSYGIYMARSHN